MSDVPRETSSGPETARGELIDHLRRKEAAAVAHRVTFARNRFTGDFKGECSCGWCRVGPDETQIRTEAAVHDMAWEAVDA